MKQQTTDKKWFDDLVIELRLRQVSGSAIGDAMASARELLRDTGQQAEEAFGPARDYAAALALPTVKEDDWIRKSLWPVLLSLLAFLLFSQAATSWARSEPMLVSPAQVGLLLTPVVLVALLPLYLDAVVRRMGVLITLAVVCALSGLGAAVLTPGTPSEAWLVIDPLPWLLGTAVIMVVVSVVQTIGALHSDDDDEIIDPSAARTAGTSRRTLAFVLLTAWLFPLLAVAMLALAFVLR
jgi:hypothetical protein